MTPILRAAALRFLAVSIPVALACWCWLTLIRLAEAVKVGTPAWDVGMALAMGVGSALIHAAALRLAGARPARGAAVILASLPLIVALAAAQATYADGVVVDGIDGGFSRLAMLGRNLAANRREALALVLGASVGFALPLAHDARSRVNGERAPGRGLVATLVAMAVSFAATLVAPSSLIDGVNAACFTLVVAGLPLTVLLGWASLFEDHLQGWKRSPTPAQPAG